MSDNFISNIYETNKNFNMKPNLSNGCSHNKEYYRNDVDFNKFVYKDRIYYTAAAYRFNRNAYYVCSSNLDGSDVKIISCELNHYELFICVNTDGIYVYEKKCIDDNVNNNRLFVKRMNFEGGTIYEATFKGNIHNIYIYRNYVYFVLSKEVNNTVYSCIKQINTDSGEITDIYNKLPYDILNLYAAETYLIFECGEYSLGNSIWVLLNFETNKAEYLNSNINNSESTSFDCNKSYTFENENSIVFFDLNNEIFWSEEIDSDTNEKYLVPHYIFKNKDLVVENLPIWKISLPIRECSSREYFDGAYYYCAENYYRFKSVDKQGNIYNWTDGLHGECNKFTVMNSFLFLNMEATGEFQYSLTAEKGTPIRQSWFNNQIPQHIYMDFVKRGR